MEGGNQSSSPTTDKQPLVSPSQQRPLSADSAHFPMQGVPYETDIADHGISHQENIEYALPMDPPHESPSVHEARALDWIVPVQNGGPPERRRTVGERLEPTLMVAKSEQAKYAERAKWAGIAVNGAMFAQIVVNALVTGLSAAPSNRRAQIGVSAMGALGTILASFLVRVRGTREPERSVTHAQNLEKFIRELEAFILDEGLSLDPKWDQKVKDFRTEFDTMQTSVHQSENGQPMSSGPSKAMDAV